MVWKLAPNLMALNCLLSCGSIVKKLLKNNLVEKSLLQGETLNLSHVVDAED